MANPKTAYDPKTAYGMREIKRQRGKTAYRKGKWAEIIARLYLACKGYRCLAQRCRTPMGEIDLLCRKAGQLIIIEVKTAPHILKNPDSPIRAQQRNRLIKAGDYLYQRFSRHEQNPFPQGLRFDAVFLDSAVWQIKHHRNITQ